jgi:hypothetical protein
VFASVKQWPITEAWLGTNRGVRPQLPPPPEFVAPKETCHGAESPESFGRSPGRSYHRTERRSDVETSRTARGMAHGLTMLTLRRDGEFRLGVKTEKGVLDVPEQSGTVSYIEKQSLVYRIII